jgi:hypothetical protein
MSIHNWHGDCTSTDKWTKFVSCFCYHISIIRR